MSYQGWVLLIVLIALMVIAFEIYCYISLRSIIRRLETLQRTWMLTIRIPIEDQQEREDNDA